MEHASVTQVQYVLRLDFKISFAITGLSFIIAVDCECSPAEVSNQMSAPSPNILEIASSRLALWKPFRVNKVALHPAQKLVIVA